MKIQAIETYPVAIPLKPERRMISALGRHEVSRFVLVRLRTDEGIDGLGEATVTPRWSGETVWGARALIDRVLAPVLIGCDPADVAEIDRRMDAVCSRNWFAKSAIEMACWDAVGKEAEKPLFELLGGAVRPLSFRCRFSMGAYDVEKARRVAAERVAAGFTTIKVKVGGEPDDDIRRVRAVRETIGDEIELVVDANGGWYADTAIRCLGDLTDCRIALVEQPTRDGDYAALARVRGETGHKILADDICFDLVHARELIRQQCCDAISVYPGKQGGLRKARTMIELAAAHGIPCTIGSNLEWDVATAAMAHLVVAAKNLQIESIPGDVLGPSYHEFSIARQPIEIEGPCVTITDRPGLGIEIDWETVRQNACD